MTDLELLVDFHKDAERQGPGSEADTLKALSFVQVGHGRPFKVADIGCGTGAQTITLAKALDARITAVDLFPDFLEKLRQNATRQGVEGKIATLQSSMDELPFENETFDLIWSEGAIYNMGFESGVKSWKAFLKTGGYIALSEITWLTRERPSEIEDHWRKEYPEIGTALSKLKVLEDNGFAPVGYFYLGKDCWLDNYYRPMENRFQEFLRRQGNSALARSIVEAERQEIELYEKYKDYFSYGFYVARKLK